MRTTTKYCDHLGALIDSRWWDGACLAGPNLIQAQTGPVGPAVFNQLRATYEEAVTTLA